MEGGSAMLVEGKHDQISPSTSCHAFLLCFSSRRFSLDMPDSVRDNILPFFFFFLKQASVSGIYNNMGT